MATLSSSREPGRSGWPGTGPGRRPCPGLVQGPDGRPGPQGPVGPPLRFLGLVTDEDNLPAEPQDGEAVFVEGTGEVWLARDGAWAVSLPWVGPEGPQGSTGPQGPAGPPLRFLAPVEAESGLPAEAEDGDAIVVLATGALWLWQGGEWSFSVPWTGQPGEPGPRGLQGEPGPAGPGGVSAEEVRTLLLDAFGNPVSVLLATGPAGEPVTVPLISMAAHTCYDILCGLDFGPGSVSALERWRTVKRTEDLAAGVALFRWPSPTGGAEDRTSIVQFTAAVGTPSVSIAVQVITDAAILDAGVRNHVLKMQVVNNSLPLLPVGLAAPAVGNLPLRYLPGVTALNLPHSEIVELEMETDGVTIGYVRSAKLLGKTTPPIHALVDDARGANASVITQLSAASFNPDMYEGETMLLFMLRTTGTAATPPADRGWGYPADGDLVSGGTANGTVSGLRVAVSTNRGAAGVVDGTGTTSNQQMLDATAWRGVRPTDYKRSTTTGTTVVFPPYDDIAPGGFVLYMVCAQQAAGVVPADGVPVHAVGDAPTAGGWTSRLRMVAPNAGGDVAPPNVTLSAATTVHIIAIRMEP